MEVVVPPRSAMVNLAVTRSAIGLAIVPISKVPFIALKMYSTFNSVFTLVAKSSFPPLAIRIDLNFSEITLSTVTVIPSGIRIRSLLVGVEPPQVLEDDQLPDCCAVTFAVPAAAIGAWAMEL